MFGDGCSCFPKIRPLPKSIENQFYRNIELRKKYTREHNVTSFLTCLFEYMEFVIHLQFNHIDENVKKRKLSDCERNRELNVRSEFKTSFNACSMQEQELIYRKAICSLVEEEPKDLRENLEDSIACEIQIWRFFKWGAKIKMNVLPKTFKLIINPLEQEKQEKIVVDLRNYLVRESRTSRKFTLVLESIKSVEPKRIRIALASSAKSLDITYKLIKNLSIDAFESNIMKWKKEIVHLSQIEESPVKKQANTIRKFRSMDKFPTQRENEEEEEKNEGEDKLPSVLSKSEYKKDRDARNLSQIVIENEKSRTFYSIVDGEDDFNEC